MHDIKSNIRLIEHIAAASQNAGAVNGTALDLAGYQNASFLVSCGSVGASGTLAAKLQYSLDGSTGWTDCATADTGDTVAITQLTAAGKAFLHLTKPTKRYYRVAATVGTNAVVFGVFAALGGARHLPVTQG